jgi:hypothetical protein
MAFSTKQLFDEQVAHLGEVHFLVLYWTARSEGAGVRYNITNCFDDLKHLGITRTKQTAVAAIEALTALRFVDLREEGNRKNLYITTYGAKALEALVLGRAFEPRTSAFLEAQ